MVQELIKIGQAPHQGLVTSDPITVPTDLERIICTTDVQPRDAGDETIKIALRVEISRDKGTSWVQWGGFVWNGGPEVTGGASGRNPACDLPAPEHGVLARLVLDLPLEISVGATVVGRGRKAL